jgi:site-specific recombinase XerD
VTDFDKIKAELKDQFKLRGYQELTINLYVLRLIDLFKYYPTTEPHLISESQIQSYITILINRNLSYSTISQFYSAADYYYNHINRNDFRFNKRLLPQRRESPFETLTQEQIFFIIDNIQNIKHKTIVTLMYSCGLESSELINIKISDINSKTKPNKITIRDKDKNIIRYAIISEKVLKILREYYLQFQPVTWLFEGQKPNTPYTFTSVRSVVQDAFENAGFNLDSEIKVLKKSYLKHLTELGIPLIVVLNHLGIRSSESIERYTRLIHGELSITFTPFDRIVSNSEKKEIEIDDLESIIFSLENEDEKEYLMEAISCFRVGALRAGIVFSWVACTRFIQNKSIEYGYPAINSALQKSNAGGKKIKGLDDFETLKDFTILSIAFELGVITKHQKSQLENNLDLRNHCGHPSSYTPEINKAKAFVEDIVNIMKKK